jgi:cytochrome c-type biogenesis protein CcmH
VKPSLLVAGLVLLLAVAILGLRGALGAPQTGGDVDRETQEIARLLKCPVCQSQSVADSSSPLAAQMRELIRGRVAAGESREAIISYFAGIYGDDVLLDPPKAGFGSLLWAGVLAVPLAGLALAWWAWRGSRARSPAESDPAGGLSELESSHDEGDDGPSAEPESAEPELERELERIVGGDAR